MDTETQATVGGAENSAESLPLERRRGPRYQFTATADLVDSTSRTRVQARTSDLSRGGCYVDTTSPLPVDTVVSMGLAFTGAGPEQVEVLKKWIGALSGELQPELDAPDGSDQSCGPKGSSANHSYVVGTLVMELMRQGVLSNEKGKAMLDQLLGAAS
jgi:PilZ domain